MNTNVRQLCKSAYRLWGLPVNRVIYDFPKRNSETHFAFRLNYDADYASWPRSYAMAIGDQSPIIRIVLPITVAKPKGALQADPHTWYDIPLMLHENLIRIVGDQRVIRPLPLGKKILNWFLPKKYKMENKVEIEDYIFVVCSFNNELFVQAV